MQIIRAQAAFAEEKGLFKAGLAWHVSACLLGWKSCTMSRLKKVAKVDVFISHSWGCASWKKILAVCYHLNLDVAILLSNLACLLAALVMLLKAGSIPNVARQFQPWLYGALMYSPMCVFLVTFFFGALSELWW